jgi:hypothetical protein
MEVKNGYSMQAFPADVDDNPRLCVVLGRSYQIDHVKGTCSPTEEPVELVSGDECVEGDDPQVSSIVHPNDLEPVKPRCDLLLRGTARSPKGKPAASWDVRFQVGEWAKELSVFGPRVGSYVPPKGRGAKKTVLPPTFSEPTPIKELPLLYEHAYGGRDRYIPEDLVLYRKGLEDAQSLTDQVTPSIPEAEKPDLDPEIQAALENEDWWVEDAAQAEVSAREGAKKITKGKGSDDVLLDDVHLRGDDDGTAILDDESLAKAMDGGPKQGASKKTSGTQIIDLADAGKERLIEDVTAPDDADATAKTAKKEEVDEAEKEFPEIPCPTNPVGQGFVVTSRHNKVEGMELPQIEYGNRPLLPTDIPVNLAKAETIGEPAGFGPIARSWLPRAGHMGLTEKGVEEVRDKLDEMVLGMDPNDPNQRKALVAMADIQPPRLSLAVHNSAPDDQQIDRIHPSERVRVDGVLHEGSMEFVLPGRIPKVTVERGSGTEFLPTRLDTLIVNSDEGTISLYWRGSLPMGSLDDFGEYPLFRVEVLDLDEETFLQEQLASGRSNDNTLILDPELGLFGTPEYKAKKKGAKDGDSAIPEGVDLEVSPLLLDADEMKEGDMGEALKKLKERKERRGKVAALKAKALKIAEEEKKKEEKKQKKAVKEAKKK